MFQSANAFTQDLNGWDTSRVQNMEGMFQSSNAFKGAIDNWDVSSVTDMSYMFQSANDSPRFE